MIRYSLGQTAGDAYPVQKFCDDFPSFATRVLASRSVAKHHLYVCGPMAPDDSGQPHRGKATALPRRFLCLDIDGCPGMAALRSILDYFDWHVEGFWYTTSSHTVESPRARIVLHLDRETTREEGIRLGVAVETMVCEKLGWGIAKFDRTVYRAEQPIFTPLRDTEDRAALVGRLEGEPLSVDTTLALPAAVAALDGAEGVSGAQVELDDDPILDALSEQGLVLRRMKAGMWAVTCPFADEHTTPSIGAGDTSTVYLQPHFNGYMAGNFECKHAHCAERTQDEFVVRLGLDPSETRGSGSRLMSFEEATADFEFGLVMNGDVSHTDSNPSPPAREQARPYLVRGDEFISTPAPINWLIRDWLSEPGLAMIHGPSGAGKTFMALDWALHLSTHQPEWFGHIVHGGPVVYLAGEGHYGLKTRAKAWSVAHGGVSLGDILFSQEGVHLDTVVGFKKAMAAILASGLRPKAIFIDTVHASMQGDENKAQDVGLVLAACRKFITTFDCTVVLVHHTGLSKDAQDRGRGSGAWRGGLESECSVVPAEDGRPIQIINRKQRDGSLGGSLWAELRPATIHDWPVDRDGMPVTSVVFEGTDYIEPTGVSVDAVPASVARALKAFDAVAVDGDGISKKVWRQSYIDLFFANDPSDEKAGKSWRRAFSDATRNEEYFVERPPYWFRAD